jgi:AraC-like DNA-binding protein
MTISTTPVVRPTIPVAYVTELVVQGRIPARIVAASLEEAGLPARALEVTRMRITVPQFELLYAAFRRAVGDELFGFLAHPVPPGAFATLARLLTTHPDLAACLTAISRFYRLFDRRPYWTIELSSVATLRLTPHDRSQQQSIFFTHSMLLSPWRVMTWLSGRALPLQALRLPARFRRYTIESRYLFGCEPSFTENEYAIVFANELLAAPVVRCAGDAEAYARSSLRSLLAAPPVPSIVEDARSVLMSCAPFAELSLAAVARRLGLSRAVFARRLATSGTRFQELKDSLRRDRALALLGESSMSMEEIAESLGFSASSAFHRAFRAWTGVSPGTFRRS